MYLSPRFRLDDWDVQRWKRDNQWQRSFYTAYRPITTAVSCRSQQSIGGHECAVDGALSRDGRGHGSQSRVLQGGIVLLCPIQLVTVLPVILLSISRGLEFITYIISLSTTSVDMPEYLTGELNTPDLLY